MLSKIQKYLLWVFGAMFVLPEVLFSTTISLIHSINGKSFFDINSLMVNYRFFLDKPIYLLLIIVIEWIGVLGLIILSIKNNKKIMAILPFIILLWLSFVFILVYITGVSMGS